MRTMTLPERVSRPISVTPSPFHFLSVLFVDMRQYHVFGIEVRGNPDEPLVIVVADRRI